MNTRALALATALTGLSLGACTSPNESVSISLSAVCALTDACTFSAECEAQYIGEIMFDAVQATELWLPVQVNNQLLNNADESIGRVNTNDAHITSFEMTYQGFALATATVAVSQRVPAGGTATVGLALVPPQPGLLAPPAASGQVLARVVAKGFFENGSSFETGEFPIAFTFCSACVGPPVACTLPEVATVTCGSVGTWPAVGECIAP